MKPTHPIARILCLAVSMLLVERTGFAQSILENDAPCQVSLTDFGNTSYRFENGACCSTCQNSCRSGHVPAEVALFAGLDGSKQPQDFGANAHLGIQTHLALSGPLIREYGIGFQVGGGVTSAANAVQVFELLGENSGRVQAFTTIGMFRRTRNGFALGAVWDYQYQKSYDNFSLNQFRFGISQLTGSRDEAGFTAILPASRTTAVFNGDSLGLDPIAQGRLYWRHFWETGTQTTFWVGLAEGHSEQNVLAGPGIAKDEVFLFGADILVPLNKHVAVYGEANLMMPPDTGGVDAFLGLQFHRNGNMRSVRRREWSPFLPVASNTSFTIDLNR